MSQLQVLKKAKTIYDVANLLGYKTKYLAYILYKIPPEAKYTHFSIPKKSGGDRLIHSPIPQLKKLQQKVSDLLNNCLEELQNEVRKDECIHGFRRKRNIITNALNHRNKEYVLNLDIEDFFGSINFGRIRGFFIKDREFSLEPAIATIIAQIASHNNSLPQGSPCSPVISNLVTRPLDMRLLSMAKNYRLWYSRYADDITLSTSELHFPPAIVNVIKDDVGGKKWVAGSKLIKTIERCGFTINAEKTRMQLRNSRQEVTGLIVNKRINVPREYRRKLRAITHKLFTTGSCFINPNLPEESTINNRTTINKIQGMLGFIDYIDRSHHSISKCEKTQLGQEKIFKNFLIFKEFYTTLKPVIICEGKTDRTYLIEAIKNLKITDLTETDANNSLKLKVKFYHPRKTRNCELIGLTGGTAPIKSFIEDYVKSVKYYSCKSPHQALIILIDCDSGSKKIFSFIKEFKKLQGDVTNECSFYHIIANLYIVPTPPIAGKKDTNIEDFFTTDTLETKLGGKSLNLSNKTFDTTLFYGKELFAEHVIKKRARDIDFSGFNNLLTNICSAMKHSSDSLARVSEN